MEKRVVEHSVSTDRVKKGLTVDQNATVPTGQLAIRFLEVRGRTRSDNRPGSRGDEVLIRLVKVAGYFQAGAVPVGSALRRSRGSPRGWLDTARCSLAGPRTRSRGSPGTRPRMPGVLAFAACPREGKTGWARIPASLAGGRISTGTAPTPSAYDVIASSRLRKSSRRMAIFPRRVGGYVDQPARILIRGRNADAAFLRCLPDQSAERGKLFHPIDQGLPPARHLVVEVVMEVSRQH